MNEYFWDVYHNIDVDKIFIREHSFEVIGKNSFKKKFNNFIELGNIINEYFSNNCYSDIRLYKYFKNGNKNQYIKVGNFIDIFDNKEAMILCKNDYVIIVKEELKDLGLSLLKPHKEKNLSLKK